jgi:hypothetical protein
MSQFQRNNFQPYRATVTFHLGKLARDIHEGEYLETDGWTVKFDGEEFGMPQVKGAINDNWLVPAEDTSGARYVSKPAGVQMHAATPDRQGNRAALPLQIAVEDSHVVGTVAGTQLGAHSKRSNEIHANQQQQQLQQQWRQPQPGQQYAPDISHGVGNHAPLDASDPRHATQLVMDPNAVYETMTGQQATAVAPLPPTKKPTDPPTILTPSNANSMASSAMNAAEKRAQARALQSRQITAQRRGQQVGVNQLHPAQAPMARGQQVGVNQLHPAQAPLARGQQVGVNQLYPQQQQQQYQPQPPGPIPAQPSGADFAEYQEFMAFKQMKAQMAAQERQAQQQGLQQAHLNPQPVQAPAQPVAPPQQQYQQPQFQQQPPLQPQQFQQPPQQFQAVQQAPAPVQAQAQLPPPASTSTPAPGVPSVANWKAETKGMHWTKRADIAAKAYGNDPAAISAILAVETEGTGKKIQKLMEG